MRRRRAVSNSPASLLFRFGSSTVARFVLIRMLPGLRTFPFGRFSAALLWFCGTTQALTFFLPCFLGVGRFYCNLATSDCFHLSKRRTTPKFPFTLDASTPAHGS